MRDFWKDIYWFSVNEFDSKDVVGSGINMRYRVVFMLEAMRIILGHPIIISSGFRTKVRNDAVGGAPKSAHLTGEAVDISTNGWTKEQRRKFMLLARKLGFNGIGVSPTYIHIDVKPRMASWRYDGKTTLALTLGGELDYA